MTELKKVYIVSGDLKVVLSAISPFSACQKALRVHGENKKLDEEYVYIDERGFRTDDAKWKVPVGLAMQMSDILRTKPEEWE